MDTDQRTLGVSPAFVASLYGDGFSVGAYRDALPLIRSLGFSAFQPEIARMESLADWTGGGARSLAKAASDNGLVATQFVAHFLEDAFSTPEKINSQTGLEELKQAVECAKAFGECPTLTIPMLPLRIDWERVSGFYVTWINDLMKRRTEKVFDCLQLATRSGLSLAIEILPFSIIGGFRRFLDLCAEIGSDRLGLNLDTVHAWACGEALPLLPFELSGRIFGTHLGDKSATENGKRAPGKGDIEWKPFLRNLQTSGYRGSLDIEIVCPPESVLKEYQEGRSYLLSQGAETP